MNQLYFGDTRHRIMRQMRVGLLSLSAWLATARTEEDVKDAYIKALGLKSYFKGLVDIQTEEVWFEAKAISTPPIVMFAQLFFYVRAARKRGEPIPAFLARRLTRSQDSGNAPARCGRAPSAWRRCRTKSRRGCRRDGP